MPETEILQELGLSSAEAKLYLALLESGSTLVGVLIKKTGLHRGTVYQVLQRLKEKGMASSIIKGKKQYFEPANPERMLDALKDKEDHFKSILPKLNARLQSSKEAQEITVFYGPKGIRSVLDKMLAELTPNGEYYDFGVSGLFRDMMGTYWDIWQKRKKAARVNSKVIFNEAVKKNAPFLLKDYHGQYKFHPEEYASITDTIIYNDVVILLVWTGKPPFAVVIKNKDNADSYKNQFKMLWKHARK